MQTKFQVDLMHKSGKVGAESLHQYTHYSGYAYKEWSISKKKN
jgi:hypothetical protein